jgi:dTDP-4-dehydrorhamnose 3,5-epimerase
MKITKGKIDGLLLIEPNVFPDNRGFFFESYNKQKYSKIGIDCDFVQDNHSASTKNTLRGMHYQLPPYTQSKLVRVCCGEIFDVAVDLRKNSQTYKQWEGFHLSAENRKQLFIPKGFAHGFCVLSDYAEFLYKCDAFYSGKDDRGILWSDPVIGINWPVDNPILSEKDKIYTTLNNAKTEDLPF